MSDAFPGDCLENGRIDFDLPAQVTAYCRAKFAGQRVEVVIRPRKDKRSQRANDAFHAGLFEWAAARELTGDKAREFVEHAKDDLLALCWGYIVRQNIFTGEITKSLVEPHTSGLSVEKFSELFDVAVMEAAKDGHVWRLPEEFKRQKAA
jgi:hypothetical protein